MRRRQLALISHAVFCIVVLLLAVWHGRFIGDYAFFESFRLWWTILFMGFVIAATYGFGLPDDPPGSPLGRVLTASGAVLLGAIGISLVQLVAGSSLLPRFVVFWSCAFAVPWYALCSAFSEDVRNMATTTRVFVVAEKEEVQRLTDELQREPEWDATVVGACPPPGTDSSFADDVIAASPQILILSRDALTRHAIVDEAMRLHATGVRVRSLLSFYEDWLGKLPVSELEPTALLFDVRELHHKTYARQKRLADVLFGALLCLICVVLLPVVLCGNLLGNRGPLLYSQPRVGRNGRLFRIHKFRSMSGTAPSTWTATADQRVTRFGSFLRRTHLDELPQGWNILRGDLSIVGPRPEQPFYVDELRRSIPFYDFRSMVRPGLTGWAQVKHAYGASVTDAQEKLQYDFFYLRRQSLQLDLRILLRTARAVLLGRGR